MRSAVYGILSFNPSKPPKKVTMSAAQAAATYGRPKAIPVPPTQPTVSEAAFFDEAKSHLSQKSLQSTTKSPPTHTPYHEFLKLLHIHAAEVITRDDLVVMVRKLFWHGHGPRPADDAEQKEPDDKETKSQVEELMAR